MSFGNLAFSPESQSLSNAPRQLDYFVDGATGSDTNDGTVTDPFATIGRAILAADDLFNPGANNVFVNAGTYVENLDISDADPLTIRGMGDSGTRVVVNGMDNTVAQITDGNVAIFDMVFTNGAEGIEASNMNRLYLENVRSTFNSGSGLKVNDVVESYAISSDFVSNGIFGARIQDANFFGAIDSNFHLNMAGGLALGHISETHVVRVGGFFNGSDALNGPIDGLSTNNGLSMHGTFHAKVFKSLFSSNVENGLRITDSFEADLFEVTAADNGKDGLSATFFSEIDLRRNFLARNGENGGQIERVENSGRRNPIGALNATGGLYANNGLNGLGALSVSTVKLKNIESHNNGKHGIEIETADVLEFAHGRTIRNLNGLDLTGVAAANIRGFQSLGNSGDGLNSTGGANFMMQGSTFKSNSTFGIDIIGKLGDQDFMEKVELRNVTANKNSNGLSLAWAFESFIVGGRFSSNANHGISLSSVIKGDFVNVETFRNDTGVQIEKTNEADSMGVTFPEDFAYRIVNGKFSYNTKDGLDVFTASGPGDLASVDVDLINVVARNSQTGHGVHIGQQAPPFSPNNGMGELNLTVNGGSFSRNRMHGFWYFKSANGSPSPATVLTAKLTDVVAEQNGLNGVSFHNRGLLTMENSIQINRGYYSNNHFSGLDLFFSVASDLIDDINETPPSVVVVNDVLANRNGRHGILTDFTVDNTAQQSPESYSTASGPHGQPRFKVALGQNSHLRVSSINLVSMNRGSYSCNEDDGIALNYIGRADNIDRKIPGFRLVDVSAFNNSSTGCFVNSTASDRVSTYITRGRFSGNQGDGLVAFRNRLLSVRQGTIIRANGRYGLYYADVDNVSIDEARIFDNAVQDVFTE